VPAAAGRRSRPCHTSARSSPGRIACSCGSGSVGGKRCIGGRRAVPVRAPLSYCQPNGAKRMYSWIKTAPLVLVHAWMASVFYLPRILVNLTETRGQPEVQARLLLMGRKLYRFGHGMFGMAVILGLLLWFGYRFLPGFQTMVAPGTGWMHAKLA